MSNTTSAWLKACICKSDPDTPPGYMWISPSCNVHGFFSTYEVMPMTVTAAVRKLTAAREGGIRFDAPRR